MKILKLNNAIMLCQSKNVPVIDGKVTIHIDGVEDGTSVSVIKNGKQETESKHIVKDKKIAFDVEEGKYSVKIGKSKARFNICSMGGALFATKAKEDLEKTVICLVETCSDLFAEIQKLNKKIENLTGYDVIQ